MRGLVVLMYMYLGVDIILDEVLAGSEHPEYQPQGLWYRILPSSPSKGNETRSSRSS